MSPNYAEIYYLTTLLLTVGYTIAILIFLGDYTPDDPKTRAFQRYLVAIVGWAFFDAIISQAAVMLSPGLGFTLFRLLSFAWIMVPAAGIELIETLIQPIGWRHRAMIYAPFACFYPVGLLIPSLVSANEVVNPAGFLQPFGPWYKAFMLVTVVALSVMLLRLSLSARNEIDPAARWEKNALAIGGFLAVFGQSAAQIGRSLVGPECPMFGNLLMAPIVIAAYWGLKRHGSFLSPKSLYRATVKAIPCGLAHVRNDKITWANQSMARLLGAQDPSTLIGRRMEEFSADTRAGVDVSQEMAALAPGQNTYNKEITLCGARRDSVPCLMNLTPLDPHDPAQGTLLVFTDLTKLKQIQSQLERSLEISTHLRIRAEDANRAKSEFLAIMSHELRTPLNAIIGFSEILEDKIYGELNVKQSEFVTHIRCGGYHLLGLINDILDLAKLEEGKVTVTPEKVNVGDLLLNCREAMTEQASLHGLNFEVRVSEQTARQCVLADSSRLRQSVFNLLSNAVKFTPTGGRICLEASTDGRNLVITVADTGIGLCREDQERIFKAFEQVDSSYGRRGHGTGLGLALTKSLVEMQGGRVWVESEGEGKGSAFRISIPTTGPRSVS